MIQGFKENRRASSAVQCSVIFFERLLLSVRS